MNDFLTLNLQEKLSIISICIGIFFSMTSITIALTSWIITNHRTEKIRNEQLVTEKEWINYQKEAFKNQESLLKDIKEIVKRSEELLDSIYQENRKSNIISMLGNETLKNKLRKIRK